MLHSVWMNPNEGLIRILEPESKQIEKEEEGVADKNHRFTFILVSGLKAKWVWRQRMTVTQLQFVLRVMASHIWDLPGKVDSMKMWNRPPTSRRALSPRGTGRSWANLFRLFSPTLSMLEATPFSSGAERGGSDMLTKFIPSGRKYCELRSISSQNKHNSLTSTYLFLDHWPWEGRCAFCAVMCHLPIHPSVVPSSVQGIVWNRDESWVCSDTFPSFDFFACGEQDRPGERP